MSRGEGRDHTIRFNPATLLCRDLYYQRHML